MSNLLKEIRQAARSLSRSRSFTAATLLALVLGIGGTTAVFSLVEGVLLKPLPYPAAGELVRVYMASPERDVHRSSLSLPDFEDFSGNNTAFANLAAYFSFTRNLTGAANPLAQRATYVSADFFKTLDMSAELGRIFTPEDMAGAERVVILSHRVWTSHFGSDRSVIGSSIRLDGLPHVVVGVMPPAFRFPEPETGLWIPLPVLLASDLGPANRSARWLEMVGRLGSFVTVEQAQLQMSQIATRLSKEYPASNAGWNQATVVSLQKTIVGDVGPALNAAFAAMGLVLLLACSNVAILTLARATAREGEISVRAALGAGRWRLAREFGTESLILASVGGFGGVLLAQQSMNSIRAITSPLLPRIEEVGLDVQALGFAAAITILTLLLIGAVPALRAMRPDLIAVLKGGRNTSNRRPSRFRWGLVAAQVALAVMLTSAAALMFKTVWRLQRVDPGFTPDGVLAAHVQIPIPPDRAELSGRIIQSTDRMLDALRSITGVQAVGSVSALPLRDDGRLLPLSSGPEQAAGAAEFMAQPRTVSEDYFTVMRIPIIRGEVFAASFEPGAPMSAVISESAAQRLWPGQDAIGQELWMGVPYRVIGVVADVQGAGLREEPPLIVYRHFTQQPLVDVTFVIRVAGEPTQLASAVRAAIWRVDGSQPVAGLVPLRDIVSDAIAQDRFFSFLLSILSMVAVALALFGLVGTLSYMVAATTRDIGVRMAIGARKSDVLRLVLRRGMVVAGIGVVVGLLFSVAATRSLGNRLYQVDPIDPATYAGTTILLLLAALLTCYFPATRAARTDPMSAIRDE